MTSVVDWLKANYLSIYLSLFEMILEFFFRFLHWSNCVPCSASLFVVRSVQLCQMVAFCTELYFPTHFQDHGEWQKKKKVTSDCFFTVSRSSVCSSCFPLWDDHVKRSSVPELAKSAISGHTEPSHQVYKLCIRMSLVLIETNGWNPHHHHHHHQHRHHHHHQLDLSILLSMKKLLL